MIGKVTLFVSLATDLMQTKTMPYIFNILGGNFLMSCVLLLIYPYSDISLNQHKPSAHLDTAWFIFSKLNHAFKMVS